MKKLYIFICLILIGSALYSQNTIETKWEGYLVAPNTKLVIKVRFSGEKNNMAGWLDIPAQSALGLLLSEIIYEKDKVHFEFDAGNSILIFDGKMVNDSIKGKFKQGPYESTFGLAIDMKDEEIQEEKNFIEEEVEFYNSDNKLSGTLSIPKGDGKYPAVILISGSGMQTRDSEIFGFNIFKTISDYLINHGIAVLRYDDRGVGKSIGDFTNVTTFDFADDASAGIDFLINRKQIDHDKIGIIGHSEGAMIAAILAAQRDDLGFIVLMAGTALPGDEISLSQTTTISRLSGLDEEKISRAYKMNKYLYSSIKKEKPWSEVEKKLGKYLDEDINNTNPEDLEGQDLAKLKEQQLSQIKQQVSTEWIRAFLKYDPRPDLKKVECNTLALFGEKDLQVIADINSLSMEKCFSKSGKKNYKIVKIKDANHLFQKAELGLPAEYPSLEKDFAPGFLDIVNDWILSIL